MTTSRIYAMKVFDIKGYEAKKLTRAKTELEAIKKLEGSAHIVQVYDENISAAEGGAPVRLYYVMDYACHGSLDSNNFYIGDVQQCLRLFRQILIGVLSAHAKKVVHRDLKPGNILLYPTQREIVINDFGLGLLKDRDPEVVVTESDELLGPRHFMAPEQHLRPSEADERSDIYSLGKILYYMLTGKGKLYREKLDDINEALSEPNPYIPLVQNRLLSKMVAEKPGDRFADVGEAIDEVDRILDQLDTNSRRYLKPSERSIDVYSLLVGNQRDDFVKSFKKNLDWSLQALEIVIEVLREDEKTQTLASLKEALLENYPTGRVNAAINSAFCFMTDAKQLATFQRTSRYSFASYFIARYYLESKAIDTAHKYILNALAMEKDSALQLKYLFVFEQVCRKCSCQSPHDYDQRIKLILQNSKDPDANDLLATLGRHYIEAGDKRKGLRFLETYLSQNPYDDTTRWTCAFEYSELGEVSLSLHHHSIYLAHNPRSDAAINNMGVAYDNNGLRIAAIEKFREAYALGSTLAGANIASKYMAVGMVDSAKKLLNEMIAAHPAGNYDDRVAENLGSIVSARQREDETRKRWEEESSRLNLHHVQAIRATIDYSAHAWVGYWEIVNIFAFQCLEDKSGAVRCIALKNALLEPKLSAVIEEGCLELKEFQKPFGGIRYNSGLLYLIDSDSIRGYMRDDHGNYKMIEGARITDIKAYHQKGKTVP